MSLVVPHALAGLLLALSPATEKAKTEGPGEALKKTCEKGNPADCLKLAGMYARGEGLAKDAAKAGSKPGHESSIFKLVGTELNQRRRDLAAHIAGPQALGWSGPGFSHDEQKLTRDWLRSRGNTIEGGTSEIQLNIIAKRVLGLPEK